MHKVTDVDQERMLGVCSECGPVEVRRKVAKNLKAGFRFECREKRRAQDRDREHTPARQARYARRPKGSRTRRLKGSVCERCGFVPEDPCQLQYDHIVPRWRGGTNAKANRQTLCANCHALKTKTDLEEWWLEQQ
jgi:5-methylcytosine-specific restriction endonuclease McrA